MLFVNKKKKHIFIYIHFTFTTELNMTSTLSQSKVTLFSSFVMLVNLIQLIVFLFLHFYKKRTHLKTKKRKNVRLIISIVYAVLCILDVIFWFTFVSQYLPSISQYLRVSTYIKLFSTFIYIIITIIYSFVPHLAVLIILICMYVLKNYFKIGWQPETHRTSRSVIWRNVTDNRKYWISPQFWLSYPGDLCWHCSPDAVWNVIHYWPRDLDQNLQTHINDIPANIKPIRMIICTDCNKILYSNDTQIINSSNGFGLLQITTSSGESHKLAWDLNEARSGTKTGGATIMLLDEMLKAGHLKQPITKDKTRLKFTPLEYQKIDKLHYYMTSLGIKRLS